MLNIGETVLYGTTGVCLVEGIEKKTLGGEEKSYYVLRPQSLGKCTVFVPTDNKALLEKVRRVLSREEILNIIDSLPKREDIWVDDDASRRERFSSILNGGDRAELMLLIRTLYRREKQRRAEGKRLHIADERIMAEAERLLHDEFSAVLGIKENEVVPFIMNRLEKN